MGPLSAGLEDLLREAREEPGTTLEAAAKTVVGHGGPGDKTSYGTALPVGLLISVDTLLGGDDKITCAGTAGTTAVAAAPPRAVGPARRVGQSDAPATRRSPDQRRGAA